MYTDLIMFQTSHLPIGVKAAKNVDRRRFPAVLSSMRRVVLWGGGGEEITTKAKVKGKRPLHNY